MKYLVVGGDERAVFAAEELAKDNEVSALYLDKAAVSEKVSRVSVVEPADCVLLPLPAEGKACALNAPFAHYPVSAVSVLEALPENTLVCGGKLSPALKAAAKKNSLKLFDIMQLPEFVAGNAAITAEAAVALLMQRTDFSLFGSSVLVVGYGRIGRLLSHKLCALGVKTFVMSRKAESRAVAEALGCVSLAPEDKLPRLDAVINTAPAIMLTNLSRISSPCLMLELASAPGGIDAAEAQRLGHKYFAAPGLPGKYAPRSAGKLIAEAVKRVVKENVHE